MEKVVAKAGRAKRATVTNVANMAIFACVYRDGEEEGVAESLEDVKRTRDKGEMGKINRAASATDLMAAFGDSIICHCLIFDPDMIIFKPS